MNYESAPSLPNEAAMSEALVPEADLAAATQASPIVAAIVAAAGLFEPAQTDANPAASAAFLAFAKTVNVAIGLDYDTQKERATGALRALGELLVAAANMLADEADALSRFEGAAAS